MDKTTGRSNPFSIPTSEFEPLYLSRYRSGELQQRIQTAIDLLEHCMCCPRECGANRITEATGFCQTGRYALMSSCFAHMGEEDCIRGNAGSGTIFFSMCNLGCVFCQNYDISQAGIGSPVSPEQLAHMMHSLQSSGCHNINFVTPSHVIPQILEALIIAIDQGLHIPLVYNTSAYDTLESLQLLDGIVDIYMPDFKFWDPTLAQRYLQAQDYPERARQALREMHRQVGVLKMDDHGIAQRGVLVRHLVMPGLLHDSEHILRFLAHEISPDTYVNVMAQYHPSGHVNGSQFQEIGQCTNGDEYQQALHIAEKVGLRRLDHRKSSRFLNFF